jgi:hypothetical protein
MLKFMKKYKKIYLSEQTTLSEPNAFEQRAAQTVESTPPEQSTNTCLSPTD